MAGRISEPGSGPEREPFYHAGLLDICLASTKRAERYGLAVFAGE